MKKAVILLSGGLDSTTTLAIAQNSGFKLFGLTFRYGQRHKYEIAAAQKIGQAYNLADHKITEIDLRTFGGSALTDDLDVPKDRNNGTMNEFIPITYVPARNTIFLSFALAWAEVLGANDIFLGVNSTIIDGIIVEDENFIDAGVTIKHRTKKNEFYRANKFASHKLTTDKLRFLT